jgi:hypothetical protein
MNNTIFLLFGKYCPIIDQLDSKDSSRDFQLNCILVIFLPTFTISYINPKIDVIEKVKNSNFLDAPKQGPTSTTGYRSKG